MNDDPAEQRLWLCYGTEAKKLLSQKCNKVLNCVLLVWSTKSNIEEYIYFMASYEIKKLRKFQPEYLLIRRVAINLI